MQIPEVGNEIPCPKCNPGMNLNGTGQCVFCQKDHYSHGEGFSILFSTSNFKNLFKNLKNIMKY